MAFDFGQSFPAEIPTEQIAFGCELWLSERMAHADFSDSRTGDVSGVTHVLNSELDNIGVLCLYGSEFGTINKLSEPKKYMSIRDEKPVTPQEACEQLGCKRSYITALRRAMGIRSRYFFLSDVRKFMREHPEFTISQIYHPSKCDCAVCEKKRAARQAAKLNVPVGQGIVPTLPAPAVSVSELVSAKQVAHVGKSLKAGAHPVYSELGRKLKMLRGSLSAGAVADKAGVSTESVRRIEHGDSVKVETLRKIAAALGIARAQWLGLLIAWLKFEAGEDSEELRIEPQVAGLDTALEQLSAQTAEAMKLFDGLNPVERANLILSMRRKGVLKCLVNINAAIMDGEEARAAA